MKLQGAIGLDNWAIVNGLQGYKMKQIDLLKEYSIIGNSMTGQLVVNFNCGGITGIQVVSIRTIK